MLAAPKGCFLPILPEAHPSRTHKIARCYCSNALYWQMDCRTEVRPLRNDGFTLIEIMIVVAIIGLVAVLTIPSFLRARTATSGVRVANDLRVFGRVFAQYAVENGQDPPDSHVALPAGAGMETYLNETKWNETTAIPTSSKNKGQGIISDQTTPLQPSRSRLEQRGLPFHFMPSPSPDFHQGSNLRPSYIARIDHCF